MELAAGVLKQAYGKLVTYRSLRILRWVDGLAW
jgi:hypothetical protein